MLLLIENGVRCGSLDPFPVVYGTFILEYFWRTKEFREHNLEPWAPGRDGIWVVFDPTFRLAVSE